MIVMNLESTDTPEDTEDQWCPCFTKKVVKPRFSKGNNMSKIRLVVRSTAGLRVEIEEKKTALRNAQANLKDSQERLEIREQKVRSTKLDVNTYTILKENLEERLSELQFQLGQNDIYEQMLDQGLTIEGDKE